MTAPTYAATARQMTVLRYITGYQLAHGGRTPSLSRIAGDLALASRGHVSDHVTRLCDRGHLRRTPTGIEVLKAPAIPRTPDGAPLFHFVPKGLPDGRIRR